MKRTWRGRVEAANQGPTSTHLNFRNGAKVTIVSQGFASRGDEFTGPSGKYGMMRTNAISPDNYIGALLVKNGGVYTAVGGGLLNWIPLSDDNIEFIFNDVLGGFGNNQGGYDIEMEYDTDDLLRN